MQNNIVGPKIKFIRESQSSPITQEKLAIDLQTLGWNIDRHGISKIERGVRRVTDIEVYLLSKALSVEISDLFAGVQICGN